MTMEVASVTAYLGRSGTARATAAPNTCRINADFHRSDPLPHSVSLTEKSGRFYKKNDDNHEIDGERGVARPEHFAEGIAQSHQEACDKTS